MNFSERIKLLSSKIIKIKNLSKKVSNYIIDNPKIKLEEKLKQISKMIYFIKINHDQSFISNQLSNYIFNNYFNPQIKIADLGGGNGDVLKNIGINLHLNKENLYCIEQKQSWAEAYKFSNSDFIKYIFWDNKKISGIKKNSLDVIIIMVSLHHMTDETIKNVFKNINKLAKPNSILIIKEHDSQTIEDKIVINFEHHLYHLIGNKLQTEKEISNYLNNYIDNFKSKEYFDNLITKAGYTIVEEFNRYFEKDFDNKNPTNLYYKIYRKK